MSSVTEPAVSQGVLNAAQVYRDAVKKASPQELNATQKMVAHTYADYAKAGSDTAWVVDRVLAHEAGIASMSTVTRVRRELVAKGWLAPLGDHKARTRQSFRLTIPATVVLTRPAPLISAATPAPPIESAPPVSAEPAPLSGAGCTDPGVNLHRWSAPTAPLSGAYSVDSGKEEERVARVRTREAPDQTLPPPIRCPTHAQRPTTDPCRACGATRRKHEEFMANQSKAEIERKALAARTGPYCKAHPFNRVVAEAGCPLCRSERVAEQVPTDGIPSMPANGAAARQHIRALLEARREETHSWRSTSAGKSATKLASSPSKPTRLEQASAA